MITSETVLWTKFGNFVAAYHKDSGDFCVSLSFQETDSKQIPIVRLHSSCLFGEAFKASDCDCLQQLEQAMKLIAEKKAGAVIYKYDEGRGAGLENKIKAMALQQQQDLSTAKAYDTLGLPRDSRNYSMQISALRDLGYTEIILLTANPQKIEAVAASGIIIKSVIQTKCELNPISLRYVLSKQEELSHLPIYGRNDGKQNDNEFPEVFKDSPDRA